MKELTVVFFDMDHTVIDIDCDVSWKHFLVDEDLAPLSHRKKADDFLRIYHKGKTDIDEFVRFQLREFVGCTQEDMRDLAQRHFDTRIREHIYPQARREIEHFRTIGLPTVLLTGTNRILAEPVAKWLGMSDLIATEPEIREGRFTGSIVEPFLMKEGKVKTARQYCEMKQTSLDSVAFYADSISDVVLLEKVGQAVVVNPRNKDLIALAQSRKWCFEYWSLA